MLQLEFTAFAPKLRDADTRRIVNDQIGTTNDSCALNQLFPFLVI